MNSKVFFLYKYIKLSQKYTLSVSSIKWNKFQHENNKKA